MKFYSRSHAIIAAAIVIALWRADATAQTTAPLDNVGTVPRLTDGRPDLNGTWDNGSGIGVFQPRKLGSSICVVGCEEIPPPAPAAGAESYGQAPDRPTYKADYTAKVGDLNARQVEEDPVLRCENPGLPRIGPPDKIVQIPGQVVFLYDDYSGNYFRIVPTDGRGHRGGAEPSFLGDAVGHWEGDTLVVESVNFNDKTWLTDDGSFHTTGLRVVERVSRMGDMLHWQATAYDPAVLAEPWELRPRMAHLTDAELVEAPPCVERDLAIVVDPTISHDNPR